MVHKLRPIDYLIIGHVTHDLTPDGYVLGGTVTYAGLTAHALGMQVGILTSAAADFDLSPLSHLQVHRLDSRSTSTFKNTYAPEGRLQSITARAVDIPREALPPDWAATRLVHCAPVANEVDIDFVKMSASPMIGLTPQGWLRQWDSSGVISLNNWKTLLPYLSLSSVVVLSQEDLGGTLDAAGEIASLVKTLVVTMGAEGAMVYISRDRRHIPAPSMTEVDPTGCGDIFAATFFICLSEGDDPWTATSIANTLAACSVTRMGLASIPRSDEIEDALQLRGS